MRKLYILLAVLGLVAASCGGGGDAAADTCEGIADQAIDLIQEAINEIDSMDVEELMAMEDEPEVLTDMEQRGEELQAKASEIGCSDAEMEELLDARAGDLKAEGLLGAALAEEIGSFFD